MSLEEEERRDSRIETSKQFNDSKHLRMLFPSNNRSINRLKLGVTVQFFSLSLINSFDEILGCELSPLSRVHQIRNEAPR